MLQKRQKKLQTENELVKASLKEHKMDARETFRSQVAHDVHEKQEIGCEQ